VRPERVEDWGLEVLETSYPSMAAISEAIARLATYDGRNPQPLTKLGGAILRSQVFPF
jgi:hypothetical protein